MIGTEQRLWKVLSNAAGDRWGKLTRIETTTVDGVADVEYVAHPWNGWIELKTVIMPRPKRPFALHAPFTLTQCSWLLAHDNPKVHMRSWVLIGVIGSRTWRSFILVPAPLTTHLLHVRKAPAHEWILKQPGVLHVPQIGVVLDRIKRPN